jgi:hypothetical protein
MEQRGGVLSVEDTVRTLRKVGESLLGGAGFIDKLVSAAFTKNQREFLKHLFLQLFGVPVLDLLDQLIEWALTLFFRLQNHTVKIGKDLHPDHVD